MFDSIGFGEWFVLLAVVLIVVGPKRLPSAARTFGQYYSKFRRAAENFKRQLLDMDTEFTKAVQEVEKQPEDAFTVDSAKKDEPAAASTDDGASVPVEPPAAGTPPVEGA
ncbi:MAG: twin-arginine translocase TatA/TatE family subunit [Kiritimatiellae bacterium]|nr:twin-arginine translocase TatA/TatE family subunit [Kiritimatiellia bacterium]